MRKNESTMRNLILIPLMLLGALLLAACGAAATTAPTPAPTQDLNILRTEVAATVLAQVPQICALTPTATQMPTATATQTPTLTATATTAGTPITTPIVGVSGTPSSTGDQAKWVSQTINDGTRFAPGENFTMVWRLQNVGKTTWTSGYRLRFFSGNSFGSATEIQLDRDVAPNETIEISIAMKAPNTTGKYRSDWVMSNESLYNFNQPVYLEITVAQPGTATATATVLTPTSTPQELLPTASNTVQPTATNTVAP